MKQREMITKVLSRRNFLLGAAVSAGSAILAACGGSATSTPVPAATSAPAATTAATKPAAVATTAPAATTAGAAATTAGSTAAPAATTGATSAAQTTPNVPPSGAVTINWFASRDTTGYTPKQVDAFNKANKTIQISYQEQGATTTDLHDKFVTVATAKDPSADIVSMDVPFVPEFAAAGWTIPVDDVLAGGEGAKFYKGTIDGVTYNGKAYGVPWFNNGPGFFYRKDLLDKAGLKPPKTYDELLAACQKLQTPQIAGFIQQMPQNEGGIINWMEYLWGYGGNLVDDKLNVIVDQGTAGVDSMQKLRDFIYKDKIMPESVLALKLGQDAVNIFATGGALFLRIWYGNIGTMYDPKQSKLTTDQWDVTSLPSKDGTKPGPGCLGTWNLGVSTYSKHQKEGIEAIKWITSQDQQRQRMFDNVNLPSRPAVFDDAAIQKKYPYAKSAQASLDNLKPRPVTPFWGQMSSDAVQPQFGLAFANKKDSAAAIKDMADAMRKIIKQ
ncbi:MAG: extracellular solute-binding protein [Thermomicrobiales bacterium]